MSKVRNKRQNNVQAGLFVTLTLLLGLVVFIILTDAWERSFQSTSSYRVTFTINDGVGSLSKGSPVRLGGVLIGEVVNVTPIVEQGSPTAEIEIVFEIDSKYALYEDAAIFAKSGLLGSTSWLSISNVGSNVVATPSSILRGSSQSMVSELLGTQAEFNISKSLDSLRKLSEAMAKDGGLVNALLGSEQGESLKASIFSARNSLASIESMATSTQSAWPSWQSSVSTILNKAESLPDEMNLTLQSVQSTLHNVQETIIPDIELAMESLHSTIQMLEQTSLEYKQVSPNWSAQISGTLSNFRKISSRAKTAIDEISASPWRLLYRPTDREIAYEKLNEASWNLLTALQDLKELSVTLQKIDSQTESMPWQDENLAKHLQESVEIFDAARTTLLEQLNIDFPNR